MNVEPRSSRAGLLYGFAAYGIWGVAPIYFAALFNLANQQIDALEILAHRIVWSVAFLALLLTLWRRWHMVATCYRLPALRWPLMASSLLVALNWYVYIYSVEIEEVLQSSLGYFINPLVNVLMGMVFFRERLRRLQWLAIVLAAVGVAGMTAAVGKFPWIALSLAGCFSVYGLLRKKTPVDGLVGLSVETFVLLPVAGGYLLWLAMTDHTSLGRYGPACDAIILSTGIVTALPLMCFAQAARRLRMSTLGFLQYVSPTLQFLCATAAGREQLQPMQLECFICIWCGLAVFSVDSLLALRANSHRKRQY